MKNTDHIIKGDNSWKRTIIIKVILTTLFIPFFFLFVNQEFMGYLIYNFTVPFGGRNILIFDPSALSLFLVLTILSIVSILTHLKPLFAFLERGEDYDRARVATIRIPWSIMLIQGIAWFIGPFLYYMMHNWAVPKGHPFIWALILNFSGGFLGAICIGLAINNTLIKLKTELQIVDIRENEQDYFIKYRDYIVYGTILFYVITHMSYLVSYYFKYALVLETRDITFTPVLIFAIYLFIMSLVVYYISKRDIKFQIRFITSKLDELSGTSALEKDLAEAFEGYKVDLSNRITLTNFDDLGIICAKINLFLETFSGIIGRIRDATSLLLESANTLFASSSEIASISNQQAASIKEMVSTMEESDRFIKQMQVMTNEVTDLIKEDEEAIGRGYSFIKDSLKKMDHIKGSNTQTIREIRALGEQINSIWDIVRIINNIADQTKIIAFNAELEASAAGEAGKNFQIVASEIRRLADKTVTSTKEIKAKIDEIQRASNFLITSSQNDATAIREEWELSNNIGDIFQNIRQSSEISAESAGKIGYGIEEVASASSQILVTLRQINEGIINFVESTKFTSSSAQELKRMADLLNHILEKYA